MGGSSPRVRGTVAILDCLLAHIRFIPACAGNRSGTSTAQIATPVHPRVCGEQRELEMDYFSVDFGGVEYLIRA